MNLEWALSVFLVIKSVICVTRTRGDSLQRFWFLRKKRARGSFPIDCSGRVGLRVLIVGYIVGARRFYRSSLLPACLTLSSLFASRHCDMKRDRRWALKRRYSYARDLLCSSKWTILWSTSHSRGACLTLACIACISCVIISL